MIYRYNKAGGFLTVTLDQVETCDSIGLPTPTLVPGALDIINTLAVLVSSHSTDAVTYSAFVRVNHGGE
jgi:hypothetical protein